MKNKPLTLDQLDKNQAQLGSEIEIFNTELQNLFDLVKAEDFDPAHKCEFCVKQRATRVLKGPYWLDPTGKGLGERITCLDCSAAQVATCNNLKIGIEIEEYPEGVPLDRPSHLQHSTVVLTVPAAQ
jgi:hypothetical protein